MANLKYKNNSNEWKSILSTRGPKGDNADITINGSNLKEASFYAPISSGLIGQALISKGANQSPQWTNLAVVAGTNSYNDLDNKPTIPTTTEELISGSTSVLTSGGAYNAFAQRGIPSGGSAGQIIKKASATDYDFSWADACIDNLTSTSIITPLSANQGRVLNEKFNNYTLTSALEDLIKQYILASHPIGSIEINISGANPSTYLGGTWIAWGTGQVPVGVNTDDTDFNTVEKTGGEKTHELNVNEMPSHNHSPRYANTGGRLSLSSYGTGGYNISWKNDGPKNSGDIDTTFSGGSQPHNNLQPYITCYMWKRTV